MNAFDLATTAALLLAWALVLLPVLGFMRLRLLERRLERVQALTDTFAEVSTRLANALERSLAEPQGAPVKSEASRRSLIHAARNRLDEGAPVDRLTVQLGLRRDEACLMDIGRRSAAASTRDAAAAG